MRILRGIANFIGLTLIVMALACIGLVTQADRILPPLVERSLEVAVGAPVSVAHASVSPLSESVRIHGIKVHNPEPFPSGVAVGVDTVAIRVSGRSLFSDTPRIAEITVTDPVLSVEHDDDGGNNLAVLLENMNRFRPQQEAAGKERRFIVERITCTEGKIKVKSGAIPFLSVPLKVAPFTYEQGTQPKEQSSASALRTVFQGLTRGIRPKGTEKLNGSEAEKVEEELRFIEVE